MLNLEWDKTEKQCKACGSALYVKVLKVGLKPDFADNIPLCKECRRKLQQLLLIEEVSNRANFGWDSDSSRR